MQLEVPGDADYGWFRKLEVSEVRYEDLLSEAYSHYLKYLKLT
jgi:hypothetical protein